MVAVIGRETQEIEAREPITIRFPAALLNQARELKAERESLNELVVDAVEREVRRRQGQQALEGLRKVREAIYAEHGLPPDSRPDIRAFRRGDDSDL